MKEILFFIALIGFVLNVIVNIIDTKALFLSTEEENEKEHSEMMDKYELYSKFDDTSSQDKTNIIVSCFITISNVIFHSFVFLYIDNIITRVLSIVVGLYSTKDIITESIPLVKNNVETELKNDRYNIYIVKTLHIISSIYLMLVVYYFIRLY